MYPMIQIELSVTGVDWQQLEKDFENAIEEGMAELRDEVEQRWYEMADDQLGSRSELYKENVTFEEMERSLMVTIQGPAVGMEQGTGPYDLKPGFLRGQTTRVIPLEKKHPEKGGQTLQFRTLTSWATGWWHPGFQASGISAQIMDVMEDEIVPKVFAPRLARIQV